MFGDCETVSAVADSYIEVEVNTLFVTEDLQPLCKRAFALAFGTNKYAFSSGNSYMSSDHLSAENGQASQGAATVLPLKASAATQTLDVA